MNRFDHLRDPLGPPDGDALGTVLARARRRRAIRRGAVAFASIATVLTVAVSASAMTRRPDKVPTLSSSTTVAPSTIPSTSTTTAPSTSTTTAPPATTTTSTAAAPTTTTAPPVANPTGLWTDQHLTITNSSLGAVRMGMTVAEAQTAAKVAFDGNGDGAVYPTTLPAGYLHLYVSSGGNASGAIVCLGAELATNAPATQTVVTPEGVGIGDTVQHLKAVYGNRAQFVPAPATGLSPRAGYLVTEPRFNLAFVVDSTNTHVTGIKAGLTVFSPSSCAG